MLSIIIPALNEEKYLPLLLNSIKSQDFNNYEIILSDAGSKDMTQSIAKEHGCKIVKGGLPGPGRNRGAESAKGDILLFLDSDTILPPNFLKKALARFEKENIGIAGFRILPPDGKFIDKIAYNVLNIFSFLTQKIIPYSACCILVRRNVHEKIGGFDEKIIFIEDYPYAKEASKVSKYKFMKELFFYQSARRFDKDGRLKVYFKYITGILYMFFFGVIKTDIFKYKFAHYNDKHNNTNS